MSTHTYTVADLSAEADAAMDGTSRLRTVSSRFLLAYNRPLIDSNHVLYSRMNDGTGTAVVDSSSNNNPGAISGSSVPVWRKLSNSPSITGNAVHFLTNQYCSIGAHLNYERTQAWTMYCWINVVAAPGTGDASILFSNVNAGPAYRGYEVWINDQGHLHVRVINNFGGPNYLGVDTTTSVCDGAWHQVTVTYDGSSAAAGVKFYVDGTLQTKNTPESDNLSATIVSAGDVFRIGNQTGITGTYFLNGSMDEFKMFNIAKDQTWVTAHKDRDTIPLASDTDCVLSLAFDEGTGTTVDDASASGFDGTLQSSTQWELEQICDWLGDGLLQYLGNDTGIMEYAHIADYNLAAACTAFAWYNATNSTTGAKGVIFKHVNAGGTAGWSMHAGYDGSGSFKYNVWDGTSFRNSNVVATNGWHCYAVERSSTNWLFYIDGTLVATVAGNQASATSDTLRIGTWPALSPDNQMKGFLSHISLSKIARGSTHIGTFSKRFPASGVASLTAPGTAIASGGGDLGSDQVVTSFDATFLKPSTTNLQFRIGSGASAGAATTDKQAASYATLAATNAVSKSGRYIDFDIKLIPSTDAVAQDSPYLTDVTITYAVSGTSVSNSIAGTQESLATSTGVAGSSGAFIFSRRRRRR